MKKTIRINISGLIFNIDEDAYEKLQQYLSSITRKFINTEEGNEIIADVEARIAELFQERIGDRKEVVNLPDIDHIIEIMGKAEDFEEELDEEDVIDDSQTKKTARQIYRDTDNRVLSGLSAGIATYLGIDPVIVRVVFVLMTLFYGASILIYIFLWIIIPEAKTRSQKLEMQGKDINLSNIETSIKNEFHNVKSSFNKWQESGNYQKIKTNLGDILNSLGKVVVVFSKIILIILGISFLIMGIAVLGTMTGLFFFNDTFLSPLSWSNIPFSINDYALLFTDNFNAQVGIISSYLIILIPVLVLIYLGLKFIFRFKSKSRYFGLVAGALWSVSIILLVSSMVKIGYSMRTHEEVTQNYTIDTNDTDTLYINMFPDQKYDSWNSDQIKFNSVLIDFNNDAINLSGRPRINITKSQTSQTELKVTKLAKGENAKEALKMAKNIKYEWQQDDSAIFFSYFFTIEGIKKVKDQKMQISLEIPVGKIIYIGKGLNKIISYIDNDQDFDYFEITENYWIMTKNGLKLFSKNKQQTIEENKTDSISKPEFNGNDRQEIESMKMELDAM